MNYTHGNRVLNCIRIVKIGAVNDIMICRDDADPLNSLYTVLAVKEHQTMRRILEACTMDEIPESAFLIDHFQSGGQDILVLPYVKERPAEQFFQGDKLSREQREDICRNIVLACLSSGIPFSLLYLALEQKQVHLSADSTAHIGYEIDLEELNTDIREKDCVPVCAQLLMRLLEERTAQKTVIYKLLKKRSASGGYYRFAELYKDILITTVSGPKVSLIQRIRGWFIRHKDLIFQILFLISLILVVAAVASLLCQMIFGDVPWLRIFVNGFSQIGTESLQQ